MDNIVEPNEEFDFSKLSLAHPVGIQGGAYFTKIENNNKPLYIQTIKSQTRQGIVKTGKKYYCDLMFDKNAAPLISWFENLEERCQKLIFDRRDTWFQNNLEENDIESAFSSAIRVYKSGKFYLLRTNIKNHNNMPAVKIYNEHEIPLTADDIKVETNIISILEIQGIKFTARNFQIEIDLKQVMILDNEPMFDNCLIKTSKKPIESGAPLATETVQFTQEMSNLKTLEKDDELEETTIENIITKEDSLNITGDLECLSDPPTTEIIPEAPQPMNLTDDLSLAGGGENTAIELEFEDLTEDIEENPNELKEVNSLDLSAENTLETIQLKKPNQVYFEIYKAARNKAKIAKKNALLAYLEAKNIKKTYMLENLNDSDSDIDAEIDEVSESELDGL
jgi:hypothetical protein